MKVMKIDELLLQVKEIETQHQLKEADLQQRIDSLQLEIQVLKEKLANSN